MNSRMDVLLVPQVEKRRLAGRHTAVTWSGVQGPILATCLEAEGSKVTPLFAGIPVPASDTAQLDAALLRLDHYDEVALTSLACVDAFAQRLAALGMGPDACHHIRISLLLPMTARPHRVAALPCKLIPEAALADSAVAELADLIRKRILLLSAEDLTDAVAAALRRRGAEVDVVGTHRITAYPVDARSLRRILISDRADALICTSAVMADGLLSGLAAMGQTPVEALRAMPLIALDTAAAATLRGAGLVPTLPRLTTSRGRAAAFPLRNLVAAIVRATAIEVDSS